MDELSTTYKAYKKDRIFKLACKESALYDLVDELLYRVEKLERKVSSGGNTQGSSEVFTNTDGTIITLGGLPMGSVIAGMTPVEVLSKALFPYQAPSINISISPNTTLYEIGTEAKIVVNASMVTKTNFIISASILKNGKVIKEATENELGLKFSSDEITVNVDTSFSAKVSDGKNTINGNTIRIKFVHRSYYGLIDENDSINSADDIEALDYSVLKENKGTIMNFSSKNQKVVFAYPAIFGDLSSIEDKNGFDNFSGWDKIVITRAGVAYNVYTLRDAMTIDNGQLTFK